MKKVFKGLVWLIIGYVFFLGIMTLYVEQNEKIENGEVVQVSESYRD